ncbi:MULTISPECIES: DinB family protein [Olivibacter]|uniref:DinB family protein n=1 Tax=Olivibacter jilunii TaxID=985016 RepID=A0ABW6B5F2_9SPHI|nr:DinB family protein [Olivibacter sp. UJ_SKK_5.1]MDX3916813.1 DinB family protein [Pseudosphingobacterium sp.]
MVKENLIFELETVGLTNLIRNYVDYNLWTNITLVNWLKTKPKKLLEKEVISSFPSVLLTLKHMYKTQGYWFAIINEKYDFDPEKDLFTIDEVMSCLVEQSAQIADYVSALTVKELQEPVLVESPWFNCEFSALEYIMQFVNHNTYHRGQVVSIGRQLGFTDAPMTDYNFYNIMAK